MGMIIYLIWCTKNGKKYVGQTIRSLKERWEAHVYTATKMDSDTHFSRAIKRHGVESFQMCVLQELPESSTAEELNAAEIAWIEKLRTFEEGYNSNRGGGNNYVISEETRKKLSEARKGEKNAFYGKTHSDEAREKMRAAKLGTKRNLHTEETKEKMRQAWIVRKQRKESNVL